LTKIEINDVSLKGFTSFLNYIYSGDKTIITKNKDLEELFEMYHLAEKYFLSELKTLVSNTMQNLPFSVQNYAAVFTTVAKHENLPHSEELCQHLLERCAFAVEKNWKTVDEFTGFWSADHNDDLALKGALCKRISMLGRDELNYRNCKEGLHVRAAIDMESVEGHSIPQGSTGKVQVYYIRSPKISDRKNRLPDEPPIELYIQWDDLPDLSKHDEMYDIFCIFSKCVD
jgi:hypothetical protein